MGSVSESDVVFAYVFEDTTTPVPVPTTTTPVPVPTTTTPEPVPTTTTPVPVPTTTTPEPVPTTTTPEPVPTTTTTPAPVPTTNTPELPRPPSSTPEPVLVTLRPSVTTPVPSGMPVTTIAIIGGSVVGAVILGYIVYHLATRGKHLHRSNKVVASTDLSRRAGLQGSLNTTQSVGTTGLQASLQTTNFMKYLHNAVVVQTKYTRGEV
jgi:hypothetical protein